MEYKELTKEVDEKNHTTLLLRHLTTYTEKNRCDYFIHKNFQALNLLREKFAEQVKCVYIDPPYNTGGDDFVYKDNYQESSWLPT